MTFDQQTKKLDNLLARYQAAYMAGKLAKSERIWRRYRKVLAYVP